MIAALCTAVAVLSLGAAVRPRPPARRAALARRPRSSRLWSTGSGRVRRHHQPDVTAAGVAVWCESLARVVRSGSSLATALRTTDPPPGCADDVGRVVLALDRGSRLGEAVDAPTNSPHLDLALTVIRACARNGGPPAEPLDRAAATLRGRAADAAERQTQSAQARLSAVVMTVLPIAMLALLLATSTTTREAATTRFGITVIAVGGALNLAGWRWMRHVIAREAS